MHEIVQDDLYTNWYKHELLEAVLNAIKNLAIRSEENRQKVENDITTFISRYADNEKVHIFYKLIDDCNNLFREKGNSAYTIEDSMELWPSL